MKKNALALILILMCIHLQAQSQMDEATDSLIANEAYDELVQKYACEDCDYTYQTIYNIGLAYYMLSDDDHALQYMDRATAKDPKQPAPYYIKGSTYNYMNKADQAIPNLQKVIELETDSLTLADVYGNLGYSYYTLDNLDQALEAYLKASESDPYNPQYKIIVGEIYNKQDDIDKSIEYYYLAKENSSILDDGYTSILFNLGVLEYEKENLPRAEALFHELLIVDNTDYHAYAKLIQIYNQRKEYDKIPPLKAILYDAHDKQLIKDENLSDMFCIDQFAVDTTLVRVFERYETGTKDKIYRKLIFYILDNNEEIDYTIQTEYSPAAEKTEPNIKYILCASKGTSRINYGIGYNDETKYESIKNTVMQIIEKEPQPFD